jgi:uncharacterized protein (TIGR02246 family)
MPQIGQTRLLSNPTKIKTGVEAMRTIYTVILCVLLLLVSACAQKVNDPADVQAIKDIQPAFDKAWNAGNAEAVASGIYTADAIKMEPNQPATSGRDAIRASAQKYFELFTDEGRNVAEDVRVSGDLAVARGTYSGKFTLKAGGDGTPYKGKWITACQRQPDGSWKAFWDIYNSDLPVADALPVGAEEQVLMQIERDWAVANVKNDWAAFDKILAAEYANNVDGVITPKKQYLANIRSGAAKIESAAAGEMKVLILGETGIVHGLWTEKSTLNGKDTSGTYRYTDIFAKRDGRWQCVAGHANKVQ